VAPYPSTGRIKHSTAEYRGAYWLGDEKNPQLQRIRDVVFSKKDLDAYLNGIEEAKKRDHASSASNSTCS